MAKRQSPPTDPRDVRIAELEAALRDRDAGVVEDRIDVGLEERESSKGTPYVVARVIHTFPGATGLPSQAYADIGARITGTDPGKAILAVLMADDDTREKVALAIERALDISSSRRVQRGQVQLSNGLDAKGRRG